MSFQIRGSPALCHRDNVSPGGSSSRDGPKPADLYDAWLFAAADATLALAAWRSATRADRGDAYATYVARGESR